MSSPKRVVLVIGLLFFCSSLKCYAGSTGVASVSAVLSRPEGGSGGHSGAGAAWASAGALAFLGYPFLSSPTGFSSPIKPSSEATYGADYSNQKYLAAFIPQDANISSNLIQKALNGEKQQNIIVYELQINPDLTIKKPKVYNKSFNKKLDKTGKYSSEFISTFVMEF